jgi:hypothetical protein
VWRCDDALCVCVMVYFPSCVCLMCVARRYLYGNQISNVSSVSFAGLDNLQYL